MKRHLTDAQRHIALWGGVLVLVALVAFWIALAPLAPLFSILANPMSANPEALAGINEGLDRAAIPGGIGLVAGLAGAIMLQYGLTRKERSIEEIIDERVAEKLEQMRRVEVQQPDPLLITCTQCGSGLDAAATCPRCDGPRARR